MWENYLNLLLLIVGGFLVAVRVAKILKVREPELINQFKDFSVFEIAFAVSAVVATLDAYLNPGVSLFMASAMVFLLATMFVLDVVFKLRKNRGVIKVK